MATIQEGTLLWEPDQERKQKSNLYNYMNWLKQHRNIDLPDYHSLWT